MTTRAESAHMGRVAKLPCVLCSMLGMPSTSHVQVHHIREGQGMSQRASAFLTIPLCVDCHTGPCGIHGDRSLLRVAKVDELDLLAATIQELSK